MEVAAMGGGGDEGTRWCRGEETLGPIRRDISKLSPRVVNLSF